MIRLHQVQERCANFRASHGITVSEQAQILITVLLNGIILDPHPSWKLEGAESIEAAARTYLERSEEVLLEIAAQPTVHNGLITTFDIIHWVPEYGNVNNIFLKSTLPQASAQRASGHTVLVSRAAAESRESRSKQTEPPTATSG